MIRFAVSTVFFMSLCLTGLTQDHHFIWIQKTTGHYAINSGSLELNKKKVDHRYNNSFDQWKSSYLDQLGEDSGKVIVFFHCLYGSNKLFFQNQVRLFEEHYVQNHQGQVLYIKWEAPSVRYSKSYDGLNDMGQFASATLMSLFQDMRERYPNKTIEVLCHSMGNRLFSCLWEGGNQLDTELLFDRVYLVAADLPAHFLNTSRGLEIQQSTEQLTVYYHQKDRLLRLSEFIHRQPRLGKTGVSAAPSFKTSLCSIDVTERKPALRWTTLSNHLYYYGCADFLESLANCEP